MSIQNGEHYLGDGLYVRVDSYGAVWLRAPREGSDHYVVLEYETLAEFERWLEDLRAGDRADAATDAALDREKEGL